jgi:uncharacterized repeat protein (TIGR01451 family)
MTMCRPGVFVSVPGELAPGESVSCSATYVVLQTDVDSGALVNTVSVTGQPPTGPPVEDDDTSTIPFTPDPQLVLVKSAVLDDTVVLPAGRVDAGDTVTYSFEVSNAGNVTLTDVTVSDPLLSGLVCETVPVLLPGDSVSVTCTDGDVYVLTQVDVDAGVVDNEATASGLDPDDEPVVGTDEESVPLTADPQLVVAKSFTNADEDSSGSVTVDDTLTYTFVVENTGNVTLTGVELSDPLSGLSTIVCDDDDPAGEFVSVPGELAPGESVSCSATYVVLQTDVDSGALVNTVSVTGHPADGAPG